MPKRKYPTPTKIKKHLSECVRGDCDPNKPGPFGTIVDCAPDDRYLLARAGEMLKLASMHDELDFRPVQNAVLLIGVVLANRDGQKP